MIWRWLQRWSWGKRRWAILILLALAVFFSLVLFPLRRERLIAFSGNLKPTIDAWGYYPAARLQAMLPLYGEQGRRYYALTEVTLDLVFPILYGLMLFLLFTEIADAVAKQLPHKQLVLPFRLRLFLTRLPLALILADLAENFLLAACLLLPQPVSPILAWIAASASAVKWTLGYLCLGLAGLGLLGVSISSVLNH
jgi:hypothetical protein